MGKRTIIAGGRRERYNGEWRQGLGSSPLYVRGTGAKKPQEWVQKKKKRKIKKAFGLDRRHTVRQRLGHRYRVEGAENWREQGKRIQRRIIGELFLAGWEEAGMIHGVWREARAVAICKT